MRKSIFLLASLLISLSAGALQARTWTEAATGKKIEAEFVSADAKSVTIAIRGGKAFTLELSRLSPEDQAFVQQQRKPEPGAVPGKTAAKVEDCFEETKKLSADKIPSAGESHAALAAVDEVIGEFMAEKGIGAVTFAVSRDGKVLHDRAFGWADADLKTPLQPGVKMRLASMTKPVVKAVVTTLFTDGKLKPDDLIFPLLELGRYKEVKGCDARWQKVTIQHLLDHKGGWDRDKSGDFTFNPDVADTMKVKVDELTPEHMMRYGMLQQFDFEPGERDSYCNYGYILLARVIEKASGQKFIDCLQSTVGKEAKAPSFSLSTSDARDRQAGETWYCYHPEYPKRAVPLPFRTEARDGAGVLACTAADYCRFLETYWISGAPRKPGFRYNYSFSGSHPGVTAICSQRADGINYTAICNRRADGKAEWNDELRKVIDAALEKAVAELK
jgi:CubicO group peptidase (beta-lactamase class C family)